MGKTKIEWTDRTWNPIVGCTNVSEGCRHCYARIMSARVANQGRSFQEKGKETTAIQEAYMKIVKKDDYGFYIPEWTGGIEVLEDRLEDPFTWRKPSMVFVNSMSDLFHPNVPFDVVDKIFSVMIANPKHTFQVLTKRPERMAEYLKRVVESALDSEIDMAVFDAWRAIYGGEYGEIPWPAPNVWLGTSVENQKAADERIPHLLKCPAAVRFLSCEPLLGPVDLTALQSYSGVGRFLDAFGPDIEGAGLPYSVNWVIVGGESGVKARAMHPDWARSLRDQCVEADVPFFFKQWGEWVPVDYPAMESKAVALLDKKGFNIPMVKVGKKEAGNILDGREWNQFPQQF